MFQRGILKLTCESALLGIIGFAKTVPFMLIAKIVNKSAVVIAVGTIVTHATHPFGECFRESSFFGIV